MNISTAKPPSLQQALNLGSAHLPRKEILETSDCDFLLIEYMFSQLPN